jgi:hypothetical protein
MARIVDEISESIKRDPSIRRIIVCRSEYEIIKYELALKAKIKIMGRPIVVAS